jgi:hypothetical protein
MQLKNFSATCVKITPFFCKTINDFVEIVAPFAFQKFTGLFDPENCHVAYKNKYKMFPLF